jgi:hypothetical protein
MARATGVMEASSDKSSLWVVDGKDDVHSRSPSSSVGAILAMGLPLTKASMCEASMPMGILAFR